MSKVLVTGANGFIGQHVAKFFHENNNEVLGIDTTESNTEYVVERCNIMFGDIDAILLSFRPEIVVHCAGLANVSYSVEHPYEDFQANTAMVHKILYAMRDAGLEKSRFVFLSSAGVYGQPESLPISEDAITSPVSPYALHKRMAEDICLYFADVYGFDIRIARVFSAYGPGLRKQLFWDLFCKMKKDKTVELYGTGLESRDFIYIDDLVNALYIIAMASKCDSQIYNVANGEQISIYDAAALFSKLMGNHSEIVFNNRVREGDPQRWCADVSKIRQLGYCGKTNLENGLRQYIEWANNAN